MKRGYALLVTLFLIFSISLILLKSLTLSNLSIKESGNFQRIVQLNLATKDTLNILKNSPELKDLNDTVEYDNFLAEYENIPFSIDKEDAILLSLEPSNTKININDIKSWDSSQKRDFINYLRAYGVSSAEYFWDILQDALDQESRATALKEDMPLLANQKISNKRVFDRLISYYIQNSSDLGILNVPWDKLIDFKGNGLDVNHMSCEVWRVIFGDRADEIGGEICHSKKVVKELNSTSFSKDDIKRLKRYKVSTNIRVVSVTIRLSKKNKNDIISTFDYDIDRKKALNVAMDF